VLSGHGVPVAEAGQEAVATIGGEPGQFLEASAS
jgi:hypothetical protein